MLKPAFYLLLAIIMLMSFKQEKGIDAYEICQIIPDISMAGTIDRYDTPVVQVFYCNDLILYRLNYWYSYTNNDVVEIKDQRRMHYILFNPKHAYGFDFDEHKTPFKRKILIDSAFNGEWAKRTQLYPMFSNNKPYLLSSLRNADSLIETYKVRNKKDTVDIADFTLKFTTSINDIELSISKELDSIKQMKLYELSFWVNPDYLKPKGIVSGRYYSYYHLRRLEKFDREYIVKLFNSYTE